MPDRTIYMKISALSAIMLFSGCSGKPVMTPGLQQAHAAYEQLRANRTIEEKAPLALLQTEKIYALSQKAKDTREANHLAYLLDREVAVTREKVRKQRLEQQIASLKAQKQKAQLEAKESELLLLKKKMQQTEAKLKELEALNAKETNRGLVLTLGDVLFESGRARLLPGSERTLDKLVTFLEENPQRKLLIEGHTDNVGSSTYNLDLSLRRAEAVKRALVAKGIDPQRITAQGYGETYPVASNADAAGRQRNRRVEIVILDEGVSPDAMQR